MSDEDCCANCRHFLRVGPMDPLGNCRRYPRTPLLVGMRVSTLSGQQEPKVDSFFPLTRDTEVCGEHVATRRPMPMPGVDLSKLDLEREPAEGTA